MFGLILKNKMAAMGLSLTVICVDIFSSPFSSKNYFVRLLKFAEHVRYDKSLPENIFGLILKNKMAATGVSLIVMCIRFSR